MQYRTHFTTSLAITLPIMANTGTIGVSSLLALGLGSVFPDIDEPYSWIGSRTRGLSDLIKGFFGHRGITHSLFGLVLALFTIGLICSLTPLNPMTGVFFVLGYALHLIEDSFSKSGVKWLLPLSNKSFQFGNNVIYYTTGSLIENLILLSTVMIIVFQLKYLDFSYINVPQLDLLQNFKGLVEKIPAIVTKLKTN